jgi:2-polyprenyl-3-methyl-5-hydroxy-6-metoxy-1,4-benzoquinol methylase/acyl carrier protein
MQLDRHAKDTLQDKIVVNFLIQLLELDKIDHNQNWNPFQLKNITTKMIPVLHMWANWLTTKKVFSKANTGYAITSEIEKYKTISFEGEVKNENLEKLQFVHTRLIDAIDTYKAVLNGAVSEIALLELEGITPEYLSTIDSGTKIGIQGLAEKINALVANTSEVIRVGIFGGRTGLLAQQLLEQIHLKNVSFTVFDNAASLLEIANEKLKKTGHIIDCVRVLETEVPEAYKYQFDIVLGINVFHRYKIVNQGLDTAMLMLKNDGVFMALEHYTLAPIALVTSAVLDKAFIDFDVERKRKASPMLTGEQWKASMIKSGFVSPSFVEITGTYSNYLEAKVPLERVLFSPEDILESIREHVPAHMLPEKIQILPFIPLSANGKVDKKAFAAQFEFLNDQPVEAPQEGMETEIANIWKALLQLEQIGRNQVFFQIGGDSLSATRFLSVIKEKFEVELSLREIFEAPLKDIAVALENKVNEQALKLELMEEGEI